MMKNLASRDSYCILAQGIDLVCAYGQDWGLGMRDGRGYYQNIPVRAKIAYSITDLKFPI